MSLSVKGLVEVVNFFGKTIRIWNGERGEALGVSPLLEERLLLRWGSDSLLAFRSGWPEVGAVEEHGTLEMP